MAASPGHDPALQKTVGWCPSAHGGRHYAGWILRALPVPLPFGPGSGLRLRMTTEAVLGHTAYDYLGGRCWADFPE